MQTSVSCTASASSGVTISGGGILVHPLPHVSQKEHVLAANLGSRKIGEEDERGVVRLGTEGLWESR